MVIVWCNLQLETLYFYLTKQLSPRDVVDKMLDGVSSNSIRAIIFALGLLIPPTMV